MDETRDELLNRWNTPPQVSEPSNDGHGEPARGHPWEALPSSDPALHDTARRYPNKAVG